MNNANIKILLVDDDELFLKGLHRSLKIEDSWEIHMEQSGDAALKWLENNHAHIAILDINMPVMQGDVLLDKILSLYPEMKCLMLTAHQDVNCAIKCIQRGAVNFLSKPIEPDHLYSEINRITSELSLAYENRVMKKVILTSDDDVDPAFNEMITRDPKLKMVFQYISNMAITDRPILIYGETGTGKDLMAQAIHNISLLKGNYVTINVAGLDDTLFSDVLFGHMKGSYTGADTQRQGLLEEAKDGTIFFDEFGDLEISSQIKLLRLIQNREYHPIGSDRAKKTNARFVFATNQDIEKKVEAGTFRKDLYYRINSHKVELPALRKRKGDISLLVEHFVKQASILFNKRVPLIPTELFEILESYSFPGNIREMEGIIFDAVATLESGVFEMDKIKSKLTFEEKRDDLSKSLDPVGIQDGEDFPTLKSAARMLINEALRRSDGNQSVASKMLGITRQALNSRLRSSSFTE